MVGSIRLRVTVPVEVNGVPPLICPGTAGAGPFKGKKKCATMKITQIEKNGIIYITVVGRAEAELTPEFEETVQKIIADDKRQLLFDLGDLEYLKSSVLRVILNAVKEINRRSGKVALCSLNEYAKEIFEVNSLNNSILITESVESGLNVLLAPSKAA